MEKTKKTFEKLFWLLLLASPALDLVNGIWSYVLCGGDGGMLSSLDIKGLPTLSPASLGGVHLSSDSKSCGTWCLSKRHPAPL